MRTRTWCVAAALVCLPRMLAAQTVLSEADALARLSADSPRVRAIRAGVDVARADVLAAGRWPNPRVTYNRESVAGVTENMFLVTQALPITGRRGLDVDAATALVAASERRADRGSSPGSSRAAQRLRGPRFGAGTRGRDRPRSRPAARPDRHPRAARKRPAMPPATTVFGPSGRRWISTLNGRRLEPSVRGRRPALAGFFAASGEITSLAAVVPQPAARPALPGVEALVAHAETTLPELAALRQEIASAEFAAQAAGRRPIPEPEVVAGTKSSNLAGGDIGGVFSVHVTRPALRSREAGERAGGGASRSGGSTRRGVPELAARAGRGASRDCARATAGRRRIPRLHGDQRQQLERIAQVSYDAGERGILELLDAYRSGAAARTRQVAAGRRRPSGGDRARTGERMGDPMMRRTLSIALILGVGLERGMPSSARRTGAGLAVTELRRSTSRAGRSRPNCTWSTRRSSRAATIRFAVHLTRLADFQRARRRTPVDRDDARGRRHCRRVAGIGAASPRRVSRRRQAAASRTLSLGAGRLCARAFRPARSRRHDRVRRRAVGRGRRRRNGRRRTPPPSRT